MTCAAIIVAALALLACGVAAADMPLPWTTALSLGSTGSDVLIAQNLLVRDPSVLNLNIDGTFGPAMAQAVAAYQTAHSIASSGVFDACTAQSVLDLWSRDGVTDTGFSAKSMGYKYKLHVPVHSNRSIETIATLFDGDNTVMLQFTVRSHGYRNDGQGRPWPDFSNDIGLNQFTSNGATVTGVIEIDLNTPEPDPKLYGPWPVNRLVRGLAGNAKWLLPTIRDGQLLHTGKWSTPDRPWTPTDPMPNSEGCIHAHPEYA